MRRAPDLALVAILRGAIVAFVALCILAALAGCAKPCGDEHMLVPAARVLYEVEWSEPEARAGVIAAGFDPGELPFGPAGYVTATNGAVTLISRQTTPGSDLHVSFVGKGELGLDEGELTEAKAEAERALEPALLDLIAAFEDGSGWPRAAPHAWEHAVSAEACA